MKIRKPKCDSCGGTKFDEVSIDPLPEDDYISAFEYFNSEYEVMSTPTIMVYHHYIATCKSCGREYRYTM